MAYQFSRYEQETTIRFNEDEKLATVETYNTRLKNKLTSIAKTHANQITIKLDDGQRVIALVPKKWVKVNAAKIMSDEQRESAAKRLRERMGWKK